MSKEQNPFNIVPEIPLAYELLDSQLLSYQRRILIDQVWPGGQHAGDLQITIDNVPSEEDIEAFRDCLPTLAWITIQACPVLVLPRSDQYSTATGKSENLVLRGAFETVYPKLYCVERGDMPTLLTTEEIKKEGSLRPDMVTWLSALRDLEGHHNPGLDPLYAML